MPLGGVGFVPTMGALHDGHMSLVQQSVERDLFTVTSIFVNPTQFNNPVDFEQYLIDITADCQKLEATGCDVVFIPDANEIYPTHMEQSAYLHEFGALERCYEGAFRPGHFRGVAQVVHILLECVRPTTAFFGEKDFQQLAVVRELTRRIMPKTAIVAVPTMREHDGLAMSSRNRRLDTAQRQAATLLFECLELAKSQQHQPVAVIQSEVNERFQTNAIMELEYFDIVDSQTFEPLAQVSDSTDPRALIAAYAGEVRLIDNMAL